MDGKEEIESHVLHWSVVVYEGQYKRDSDFKKRRDPPDVEGQHARAAVEAFRTRPSKSEQNLSTVPWHSYYRVGSPSS